MRKNKIGDVIFGLLLAAFCLMTLLGCAPAPKENCSAKTNNEVDSSDSVSVKVDSYQVLFAEDGDDDNTIVVDGSVDAISEICGLTASVETDSKLCRVDTENGHNPYDVVYDYGKDYQAFVDACDWSLVFDAEYYMSEFPMLALQYHYDEELLLEHFQTVGIHEGRQGSAKFNAVAFAVNSSDNLMKAFGKNYEGYYFYYMLNYDSVKNTNTVSYAGHTIYTQYKTVLTAIQKDELAKVNYYRSEVDSQDVVIDGELNALANYRAYLNAHDGWKAHDWAIENDSTLNSYMNILGCNKYAENTVTCYRSTCNFIPAFDYRDSEFHYKSMVAKKFNFVGVSNFYNVSGKTSQFDIYTEALTTPMH